MTFLLQPRHARILAVLLALTALPAAAPRAAAESLLLIEADSGKVLHAENAAHAWYPASVTKMMTAYVTLRAVKERRFSLDTLLTVSQNAAAQQPSKMGFKPGTQVTVDNALKMLMVKSANDMAVVLAEGVSGSIERFADDMNRAARRLGMTQSNFVNPNGLPADNQVTSARDLGILARAMIRELPEYDYYWRIPAIRFGKRVTRNFNRLIDRYPGADGMKTGFICASGFNLVATATRNGRRLIAVVLGAPSSSTRAVKAAELLERGFNTGMLSWLAPSLGSVESLVPVDAPPPNLRDEICGKRRKKPAADSEDADDEIAGAKIDPASSQSVVLSSLRAPAVKGSDLLAEMKESGEPVEVYVGPKRVPGQPAPAVAAAPKGKSKSKIKAANANAAPASKPAPAGAQPLPTQSFANVGNGPAAGPSTFVPNGASAAASKTAAPASKPRRNKKQSAAQ